ncbi:t-SNARE [Jaminaea rosea]|uniref:t-SNARE n=1 Tax=Jaminaea rosea TaxID=1569628 RepID=A0A316UZX7_9BASI|nr:t-SNARE [Jaminaea rosea]PWN30534.1 t-SNARE [Jaminaea rosea]
MISRSATPTGQSSFWSRSSTPPVSGRLHPDNTNSHHAASSSTSSVEADFVLGVTRSRTLLFLSYRDSVPRSGASRRVRRPTSDIPRLTDGSPAAGDPLGASSKGKGKGKAKADNGGVYFDFDDEDDMQPSNSSQGYRDDYEDAEQGEASGLLDPTRPSVDGHRQRDHLSLDMDGPSSSSSHATLPPRWVDVSDQIDSILSSSLPSQISTLDRLQAKHLLPGFVDRTAEEREIARLQGEITREFSKCTKMIAGLAQDLQRKMQLRGGAGGMTKEEAILAKNVQTALAQRVQSASGQFRKKQTNYMQRLRGQDVRHREVIGELGLGPRQGKAGSVVGQDGGEELAAREDMELGQQHLSSQPGQQQQQDLLLIEGDRQQNLGDDDINQRHNEITRLASSIVELSQLFQDLQGLVLDQGSLVDRIDYNIESMARDMERADEELKVATRTQRRTGRGQCILFLILLCALLVTIIIVKPFWRFFFP